MARAGLIEELRSLKTICDEGLLTSEECAAQRKKLLETSGDSSENWFCNYAGETTPPAELLAISAHKYSEAASASSVVKEIIDEAGLAPSFVVRPANVANAAASLREGQRYVEYSTAFISQLKDGTGTNWAVYSVMAHEMGHHLQGHTLLNIDSRPDLELEADEYSGFILQRLGATLEAAQSAMKKFGSDKGSETHPGKSDRMMAIKRGWDKAKKAKVEPSSEPQSTTSITKPLPQLPPLTSPPIPQPSASYTDSCVVQGEPVLITSTNLVLSKARGYSQVGQRVPPSAPQCAFDLVSANGRYCVGAGNGQVFFGSPIPVGQCWPCAVNVCN